MKLSLAWIFDHIDADWHKVDVPALVAKFNQTTAEIEGFDELAFDLKNFSLAQVKNHDASGVTLHSPEWKTDVTLPERNDVAKDAWYLIKRDAWATGRDFGCAKDYALPAMWCDESLRAGGWKQRVEDRDVIIEVDNKSITNRPDMWGHRGFAREIAAILALPFKKDDEFLASVAVDEQGASAAGIKAAGCKRFSTLSLTDVEQRPSLIPMALRLLRVDSRPIDAIVDFTNYVMLDISQPMHAFDAAKLGANKLVPRMAHNKEKLTVLDGTELTLTTHDMVVTDGSKPLALAGIKGGLDAGIDASTTALLLESANFDATTVRLSSARHKLRTDASARFEKTLDPAQNTDAHKRFVKLLDDAGMQYTPADTIVSLGALPEVVTLTLDHDFIQKRLGAHIEPTFIEKALRTLGFGVEHDGITYAVQVPSFRSAKDVTIKEDVVEEIGRFFGYTNVDMVLPAKQCAPSDLEHVYRVRRIKQFMAYSLRMREVSTYSFFDESFINELGWQPTDTVSVQSPVSENWQRLVTTLVPNMFKAVADNKADHDSLRFFEWARVWRSDTKNITEKKSLTAIFFEQKKQLDFFALKAELANLFALLSCEVSWHKIAKQLYPWQAPHQTAELKHNGVTIGVAGMVDPQFLKNVADGSAFIIELDGDYLIDYNVPTVHYQPAYKYPGMARDMSMLMPLQRTVADIEKTIAGAHDSITEVALVDCFEKAEWVDQRALTFRFVIRNESKTLTKAEADAVWEEVARAMKKLGAEIR